MTDPTARAVRHAGIVVSAMDRSLAFYRDQLGLQIVRDAVERGDYIDAVTDLANVEVRTVKLAGRDGGALVELLEFRSHVGRQPTAPVAWQVGASHVALTVHDLRGMYRALSALGVQFNAEPQLSPDGTVLLTYCRDPDGTFVELVEELPKVGEAR
jgi:catechol 2,3-dioxygenase-like lactoylglutathione lyase family enzyme